MTFDAFLHQLPDADSAETGEWLESLDALVASEGTVRTRFVIGKLLERARRLQVPVPSLVSTPYINTIPPDEEPWFPGDEEMERRIRRIVRWNAAAMVTRANKRSDGIGGHLSTYASAASLYEVGFNHFFKGKDDGTSGDQIYYQGHAAPGMYSHAYLEGRITEAQMDNFRQETGGNGLSSYPHPRLMPDFWEFPTVSMGLGPLNAIYQARFNRYLYNRHIADTSESRVWCFLGDGECDEPETLGALSLAAREQLDNLTFVVNCNLQRLDGPVRGNGKVIQELEGIFRGAGWNVIKVIWAREWDELLARDVHGVLVDQMNRVPDGEFQKYATESGAYIREHFFGPDPRLRKMVEHLSDDDLRHLRRGGHDYRKVYSAYKLALEQHGAPTVILAHTVKGWTLGTGFEARNSTHQIKKIGEAELRAFRDLLELPISDKRLADAKPPYYHPGAASEEVEYLLMRRRALGGVLPRRVVRSKPLELPGDALYSEFMSGSGTRAASTTMVFAGLLRNLLRDPGIGNRVVPIIPDEARTFGMDALFSEVKIYAPFGQRYEPVDAGMVLSYREAVDGQILEEGITEAGSMGSFTAAGTAYATHGQAVIPFYIYYSMFGYQRVGDLIWAFGDSRGRGFMLGGTAGRTTLNGEGLQHEDGHSPLLFSAIPNVRIYDPAFAYELATVIRDGMRRMYVDGEDIFYYITLYNENYPMPPMQEGSEDGILRGLYLYKTATGERAHRARILASGSAVQAAVAAQSMLLEQHDVAAEVWSATSFQLLRQDALEVERWNRLHPDGEPRVSFVDEQLGGDGGPIVAVTDYMKAVPDQIGRFFTVPFIPLGTDGYGRSDTRVALRRHFEVDAESISVAVLDGLAQQDRLPRHVVAAAIEHYGLDTELADPRYR
ncbi:MAG TPA: pyruvate dehydrogenase (acetyl-transferring), homodimeric type [Candidatus Dormibacteraeota bacterium]|jgi:pyruvate dehydrogenase E1 component|nr:pyruvate dehydrogenase (acetyl-transferring), homodimeric type [Candidatus Dormibacteraeota bacterium]